MLAISAKEKPQKNFRSTSSASGGVDAASSSSASPSCWSCLASAGRRMFSSSISVKRDLAAALLRAFPVDVVDDQPAHRPRCVFHEAMAIREHRAVPAVEAQVGFVQQRRGAHRQRTDCCCGYAPAPDDGARCRARRRGRPLPPRRRRRRARPSKRHLQPRAKASAHRRPRNGSVAHRTHGERLRMSQTPHVIWA